MTVEEAARILSKMYHASKTRGRGRATTAVHLFGIKYANDLSRFTVDNGHVPSSGVRVRHPVDVV